MPKPVVSTRRSNTEALPKPETSVVTHRLGLVFNFNKKNYPYFTIDAVIGEADENADVFTGKVEKLDLSRYVDTENFPEEDRQLLTCVRKLQEQRSINISAAILHFPASGKISFTRKKMICRKKPRALMAEYLFPKLKKLFADQCRQGLDISSCKRKSISKHQSRTVQYFSLKKLNHHFI